MTDEQFSWLVMSAMRREALLEEILIRTTHPNGCSQKEREALLESIDDALISKSELYESVLKEKKKQWLKSELRSISAHGRGKKK